MVKKIQKAKTATEIRNESFVRPNLGDDVLYRLKKLENSLQPSASQECFPESNMKSLGGGINSAKAEHQGSIGNFLTDLSSAQDQSQNVLDELFKKLDPILLSTPVTGTSAGIPPVCSHCSAGEVLLNRVNNQRTLNSRLGDLLFRIAL